MIKRMDRRKTTRPGKAARGGRSADKERTRRDRERLIAASPTENRTHAASLSGDCKNRIKGLGPGSPPTPNWIPAAKAKGHLDEGPPPLAAFPRALGLFHLVCLPHSSSFSLIRFLSFSRVRRKHHQSWRISSSDVRRPRE